MSRVAVLRLRIPGTSLMEVLSGTNVIQESRAGRRFVYLPTHRLPAFDRATIATWTRLGYEVVPIDALGPAMLGGGVRCLSQVVRERPGGS